MQNKIQDMEFVEENKECSYFNDETSDIRYKFHQNMTANMAYNMLDRGWRRFGKMNFVPECKSCDKCISIRIDVKNYKFSKSEKRVFNKNIDTELFIQKPSLSHEHLNLYDKYHTYMQGKKKWNYKEITADDYFSSYVDGANDFGKEILYVRDGKLVAVALCDFITAGISSIYCYYDHDYKDLSLGKYSILAQIQIAKNNNIPYIYLGYWIKDHFSMGYKENYQPYEYLINRPNLDEEPIWRKYE